MDADVTRGCRECRLATSCLLAVQSGKMNAQTRCVCMCISALSVHRK